MRQRWNVENQEDLYVKYFRPLYTESALDYLELIYFEEMYERAVFDEFYDDDGGGDDDGDEDKR